MVNEKIVSPFLESLFINIRVYSIQLYRECNQPVLYNYFKYEGVWRKTTAVSDLTVLLLLLVRFLRRIKPRRHNEAGTCAPCPAATPWDQKRGAVFL